MALALLHQYQKYLDRLIWKQLCHNRAQILPICCHRHCLALCASQHFSVSASSSCLIILILLPTERAKSITTATTQDWSSDQLFGTSISEFLRASYFSLRIALSFILVSQFLTWLPIYTPLILFFILTDNFLCCTVQKPYTLDLPFDFSLQKSVKLSDRHQI